MLEGHVLRRRYDVSYLPTIALGGKLSANMSQLHQSASTFVSGLLQRGRSQAYPALQTPFPPQPHSSGLLY